MDFQKEFDAMVTAQRELAFSQNDQLCLGDLIDFCQNVKDKTKTVVFDDGTYPLTIDSWRGLYKELALDWNDEPNGIRLDVSSFLKLLVEADGGVFTGYKGGEFVMSRSTPIWIANYSQTSKDYDKEGYSAVVGIEESKTNVVLKIGYCDC